MEQLAPMAAILKVWAGRSLRRQIGNTLLGGLALLFLGVAIIAGIVAVGVMLATRWGVLVACLIIALAALVVAALLVVVVAQRTRQARFRQREELAVLKQTMLAVQAIVPTLVGGKGLLVFMALGVLVGFMATRRKP